jgi:hypothetical protein
MFHRIRVLSGVAVAVALVAVLGALGSERPAQAQSTTYVYSVGFVCGDHVERYGRLENDTQSYEKSTKVANYAFKLDASNPSNQAQANITGFVHMLDREAAPPFARWPAGVAAAAMPATALNAGDATMIDCIEIAEVLGPAPVVPARPYYSGKVTLRSDNPLIVWATQTMCSGGSAIGAAAADIGFCAEGLLAHVGGDDMAGLGASIDFERVEPLILEE